MQTAGLASGRRVAAPAAKLYGVTVLVSSALVFWVQPLAVRGLLPVMGGAPLVWNTAMLFFQATLLAGYLLAHLFERRLTPKGQLTALGCLWSAALITAWSGGAGHLFGDAPPQAGAVLPVAWLLGVLAATHGPASLSVSMLSPLVSAWLSRARGTADPYALYAVSNAASIGALVLYPFVLEPVLGVRLQLEAWNAAFAGLFPLLAVLIREHSGNGDAAVAEPRPACEGMPTGTAWRVVALALLPGALLHGVALSLSTDVASAPFLWVAPLALYLGTYALVFGRRRPFAVWRGALSAGPLPAGLVLFAVLHGFTDMGLWWGAFHLTLFGLVALWCHGRLWELRPAEESLTRFYVLTASGGLAGGVLSVLVFPAVFAGVWEYPLLFALAALALPGSADSHRPHLRWARCAALATVAAAATVCLHVDGLPVGLRLGAALVAAGMVPGLWTLRSRPAGLAAALLVVSLAPLLAWPLRGGEVIARQRTWFGVYRVVEMGAGEGMAGRLRLFFHGTTLHGMARWRGDGSVEARTGYYAPEGPYGDVMRGLRQRGGGGLRLGVVGLGAGSLLCYARPGDAVTVYEIDPAVVSLAREYFTALEDCAPQSAVLTGDGRRGLREAEPESLDALFLDAFASGSIPVHLLTLEALRDYLRVLSPGGVLAVHISNRHLDLEPLLALAVGELGVAGTVRLYPAPRWSGHGALPMMTHLAVLAGNQAPIDGLELGPDWRPLEARRPTWWRRAWTDDAASLVPYLR